MADRASRGTAVPGFVVDGPCCAGRGPGLDEVLTIGGGTIFVGGFAACGICSATSSKLHSCLFGVAALG